MKSVVLFQPKIGDWDSLRTKPSLPLGLLSIASLIHLQYKVHIIDQRITKDWKKKLMSIIDENTICAGVSSITGSSIKEGLEFSNYIKNNYSIPVVWGGIHASIFPRQTLQDSNIDLVVEGEGEYTFYELVNCLEKSGDLSTIPGLWYKKAANIFENPKRSFCDMEELPSLAYDLVDINDYLPSYMNTRSVYFQSSRGCPFKCGYCYNSVVNNCSWRALSPEKTLKDIEKLLDKNKDIESIYFIDDNFFVDLPRAKKIIEGLEKLGLKWFSQGIDILSLKKLDPDFLMLLDRSGCLKLTVGIESASPRLRFLMCKAGSVEDILEVNQRLANSKFIFFCCFMAGLPTETIEDLKMSADLIVKMQNINPNFRNSPIYIYTPYPGTPMSILYESLPGYNAPNTLQDWADCDWGEISSNDHADIIKAMSLVSLFVDDKAEDYNLPFVLKILISLYRPIAQYRFRNFNFNFMFEYKCYSFFRYLMVKFKSMHNE